MIGNGEKATREGWKDGAWLEQGYVGDEKTIVLCITDADCPSDAPRRFCIDGDGARIYACDLLAHDWHVKA